MEGLFKIITDNGIAVVCAAAFIYQFFQVSKTLNKVLTEFTPAVTALTKAIETQEEVVKNLQMATNTTTSSVNLVNATVSSVSTILERHDKRAEFMNNDIREIITLLKTRPCVRPRNNEVNQTTQIKKG